jgi:uncharacterized membrane protein
MSTFVRRNWWTLSMALPLLLILVRMAITHSTDYAFYFWNLFLAVLPLLASHYLDPEASLLSVRNLVCLLTWFFFLPNAPYLITDLIHFKPSPHASVYLDEVIVYLAAWDGVLLGYASIMRVEEWLLKRYATRPVNIFLVGVFLCTGLGIYIGRVLRWNSWDIVAHPLALSRDIGVRVLFPIRYHQTWSFSVLFALVLMVGYWCSPLKNQIPGRSTIWGFRRRSHP